MNIITVGKRLIPAEQIALIEPFDSNANPDFKVEKDFKARMLLINRDTVLIETPTEAFAEANGFRMLHEDQTAINPSLTFKVESFEPTEGFTPQKAFKTRLKWRDREGNERSRLLLTEPQNVLKVLSDHVAEPTAAKTRAPSRPRKRRATREAGTANTQ